MATVQIENLTVKCMMRQKGLLGKKSTLKNYRFKKIDKQKEAVCNEKPKKVYHKPLQAEVPVVLISYGVLLGNRQQNVSTLFLFFLDELPSSLRSFPNL